MDIGKYIKIWWLMTAKTTQIAFVSRFGALIFITAKLLRFFFFLLFLILLVTKTKAIAGYTLWQVILFFVTFNVVDTFSQFLLREVYRFRSYVVSGYFDFILLKPISPLVRALFGGSDILDIPMLIILATFLTTTLFHIDALSLTGIALYLLLVVNGILISTAFHIFVLAVGVMTTEVDNTIMLYRDITQMGRVPIDVYKEPIKGLMTFIIPVGIMMTFPAKALMGFLSIEGVLFAFVIGVALFLLSLQFWHFSLKHYASASS